MRVLSRAAVLVALSAVAVSPRAGAQSVVVGPLPSSMSAIPGASITVPVVADLTSSGGASLGSITARLTWNPRTLAYVSSSIGTLGSPAVNVDSASGILRFALANASGATGMPVLINVTFNVTGAPADTTILGLSVGEIAAAGTFANLTPITTGAHFCTSTGLWGDLNGDENIYANDAAAILLYAVGLPLPPAFSIANGDVDGNGVVDTRDALIVLSAAVEIPVTQFRIGHINSGICSLRSAASVQIQPRTPTVAPGDSLPVTAVVKDSTGVLVQGVGLVWQSKDPSIVRPGAAGSLVAVAPGSTYALVFVQPGVKDSVPVVVTATRHVWYVNPAVAAANLGVEFGSQVYPFSSIDTALARAAANDTVHVGVADYGPVHIAKPLVMLGDSSAGGFPRLTNATGAALHVDTVSGVVTVRGFRLLNSLKGFSARLVQTLALGSLSVEGAHDIGIDVYGVDSLQIARASVVGAVGTAISLDSFRIAELDSVRADVIAPPSGGDLPYGLHAWNASSLQVDSLALSTGGAQLQGLASVALRRLHVHGVRGPALHAAAQQILVAAGDISAAAPRTGSSPSPYDSASYAVVLTVGSLLRFDSTTVHDNGLFGLWVRGGTADSLRADSVVRNFSEPGLQATAITSFGSLRIVGSTFAAMTPTQFAVQGLLHARAHVDSTVFDSTSVHFTSLDTLAMRGGTIVGADTLPLWAYAIPVVSLTGVELTGGGAAAAGREYAAVVVRADSVQLDSIWVHDNAGSGVWVDSARAIVMYGSLFQNNHLAGPSDSVATTVFDRFHRLRVSQTVIDNGAAAAFGGYVRGIFAQFGPTGGARAEVDSSTVLGGYAVSGLGLSRTLGDTVGMVGLRVAPAQGHRTFGVDLENVSRVEANGVVIDSSDYSVAPLEAFFLGSFDIRNSQFTHVGGAVEASTDTTGGVNPGAGLFDGNVINCDTAYSVNQWVVNLVAAPVTVTNNVLGGQCILGILAENLQAGAPQATAIITDNHTGTATGRTSLSLQGSYLHAVVARNVSSPGAILLTGGSPNGNDSARVDSNTVRGTSTGGLRFLGVMHGLSLRGNLVDSVPSPGSLYGGIVPPQGGGAVHLTGNTVRRVAGPALTQTGPNDTLYVDSTVLVDSRAGMRVLGLVVGRWNFIGRDQFGLLSASQQPSNATIKMDSSSIVANGTAANGAPTWNLANNWWGSPTGPQVTAGTWTGLAPLDSGIVFQGTGGAVLDGKIYVVGFGLNNPGFVRAYDPASNAWAAKPPLPGLNPATAIAAIGDSLYAVGSWYNNAASAMVEVYDTAANAWVARAPMAKARGALGLVSVGGKLYAIGGKDSSGAELNTVEVYDPLTNTWATRSPMPTARMSFGIAVYGGLIYAIGGYTGTGAYLNAVEAYDPTSDTWTTKSSLPTASGGVAAGVVAGRLYAVMGDPVQGTVEFYDSVTAAWYPDASGGAVYSAVVAIGDSLYVIGGGNVWPPYPFANRLVPSGSGSPAQNGVLGGVVYSPFLTASPIAGVVGAPPARRLLAPSQTMTALRFGGATRAVIPIRGSGHARPRRAVPPRRPLLPARIRRPPALPEVIQ